jgi:CheY-like chemotaxis protein
LEDWRCEGTFSATPAPGRAVLIVDDDADLREVLVDVVAESGCSVFTAGDGREALSLLAGPSVPRPCLILLDWFMMPMGGEEFVERLRELPDFHQFSVVVISGDSSPLKAADPAVIGVFRKPFELKRLLAVLVAHS